MEARGEYKCEFILHSFDEKAQIKRQKKVRKKKQIVMTNLPQ